jgi:lipopolysaccharide transport system ATP-binding protein
MGNIAIRVENLSKQYAIGMLRRGRQNLGEEIGNGFKNLFSRNGRARPGTETIWALKDVSFEVKKGEVVGIIGRNGAGKSTLLKILSRISDPTAGRAEIHGRTASLLEVGTGFHRELTGRDNIYLNGTILGMKKAEIDSKFDEIVDFAETAKFIDTPVKRYSSGMYVRLAFAVAAHLEPEILIVDEVLAVGDVEFQKKCLGKMHDLVKGQGRTILFVSHNMDAIQRLCSKCLLIEDGRLVANGDTATTVARYLSHHGPKAQPNEWIELARMSRAGSGQARFVAAQYSSFNEAVACYPYANGPLEFCLAVESDERRTVGSLAVMLYSPSGTKLLNADTASLGQSVTLQKGPNLVKVRIHKLHLNPGTYVLGLWLGNRISARRSGGEYDHVHSTFEIDVVEYSTAGFGSRSKSDGVVTCHFDLVDVSCGEARKIC